MEKRHVAILGSGSWATALAKIVMRNEDSINWFIRRPEVIEEFRQTHKNPSYLSNTPFDTDRIEFSSDINEVIASSDILILAVPSPYLKQTLNKIRRSIRQKLVVSAVKGMIPDENMIVSDYLHLKYNVPNSNIAVIAGPCHAEEIALERLSYLTIGCEDQNNANEVAKVFATDFVHTTISNDIVGLEYSSVMKNIYAIAAGMCAGLHYGDNFQAVLVSNAVQEINRFLAAVNNVKRDADASGYLGDVLVTTYSRFSRNRQFGQMIGIGYSVKAAQIDMEMVAEGFYGTECIWKANQRYHVNLPIVQAMYEILYQNMTPSRVIQALTTRLQ